MDGEEQLVLFLGFEALVGLGRLENWEAIVYGVVQGIECVQQQGINCVDQREVQVGDQWR